MPETIPAMAWPVPEGGNGLYVTRTEGGDTSHVWDRHPELVTVLERGRAVAELTGDVFVFPCPRDVNEPMTRDDAADLWRAIADAVGIKEGSRIGTHSFRRAFANRLRDVPLRELKDLGGWKTEQTVIGTYLQPDQDTQRAALDKL